MAEAKTEAKKAPVKAKAAAKADPTMLVVESRTKELVKAAGLRSGEEFVGALNEKVNGLVKSAGARAKGNGRVTLQAHDL